MQLLPILGTYRGTAVEDVRGVILVLDGTKLVVLVAVEHVLEVGLSEIALIEIGPRLWRKSLQPRDIIPGHLVLLRDHGGRWSGPVPRRGDGGID